MSIPVICDRCRQTGFAGEADFSHLGDLLEFEPVPRKTRRADGWSPDRQRAFIAALSATGSKRQAATAVGKHAYGVDQLLKAEGSDSFKAAYDHAMEIAEEQGGMKIAHPRGPDTFLPIDDYPYDFWKKVRRRKAGERVVELTVIGGVPDIADYVVQASIQSCSGETTMIYEA